MPGLCAAQGDILIEQVDNAQKPGRLIQSVGDGSVTMAEGEAAGHQHRIFGSVTLYRDDALVREIPSGLYLAHVRVDGSAARLEHQEHAAITLPWGTMGSGAKGTWNRPTSASTSPSTPERTDRSCWIFACSLSLRRPQ